MTNTYNAYYRGREIEVTAETSLRARDAAAVIFRARKAYDVSVVLVAKGDQTVTHSTAEFG
jgi:hypothetical protein